MHYRAQSLSEEPLEMGMQIPCSFFWGAFVGSGGLKAIAGLQG